MYEVTIWNSIYFFSRFFLFHKRNAFHIIKSKERKKKIVVINITQLRETGKFREKRKKQFIPYLNRKMLNQSHSHQFINILWQFFGNENSLDKTIAMMIREINHTKFSAGEYGHCVHCLILSVFVLCWLSLDIVVRDSIQILTVHTGFFIQKKILTYSPRKQLKLWLGKCHKN